jgi:hypothetical protein
VHRDLGGDRVGVDVEDHAFIVAPSDEITGK